MRNTSPSFYNLVFLNKNEYKRNNQVHIVLCITIKEKETNSRRKSSHQSRKLLHFYFLMTYFLQQNFIEAQKVAQDLVETILTLYTRLSIFPPNKWFFPCVQTATAGFTKTVPSVYILLMGTVPQYTGTWWHSVTKKINTIMLLLCSKLNLLLRVWNLKKHNTCILFIYYKQTTWNMERYISTCTQ